MFCNFVVFSSMSRSFVKLVCIFLYAFVFILSIVCCGKTVLYGWGRASDLILTLFTPQQLPTVFSHKFVNGDGCKIGSKSIYW